MLVLSSALFGCGQSKGTADDSLVDSAGWLLYPFIIAADEALSPSEAYECSLGLVRERVGKICIFRLSFLPWWLLCIFVFPLFYVWGYYRQSLAVLAFEGINKKTVDS